MQKLTIRDIAKMAGVSPTVVSFVINNREGVNPKTREKVWEIVRSTNFKPNLSSRRLTMNKSFNIYIVIKNTSSPFHDFFYFEIAQGLLEKSKEYGYNIVFSDISANPGDSMKLPDGILKGDADGVVLFEPADASILTSLKELNIPVVLADSHRSNEHFPSVNADYSVAAYQATRYLIANHHRDIAFISSSFVADFNTQVFTGFSKALEENDILIPLNWICIDVTDEDSAFQAMSRILENGKKLPTAVFCATDMFAISAMRCAKQHGFRVPEDISFIGIDDIVLSHYVEPALTTIRIDKKAMGSIAMDLIIKKINGDPIENATVASDNLIIRDSVRDRN